MVNSGLYLRETQLDRCSAQVVIEIVVSARN